jgi:leucyl aminopeptidase (aminopeptidase T)
MKNRTELLETCDGALVRNLALARGESVLIVTDRKKRSIGELFEEAASRLTRSVELIEIPVASMNGEEPPAGVSERMKSVDVVLLPTSKSLSWTEARLQATQKGVRIASMPGITEEIMRRTFAADYPSIRRRVNYICDLLDRAEEIRLTTELGSDLTMDITGRPGRGRRGGIYSEKGAWGNLPCGEAFVAPVEGTCEGEYVVDAAQAGIGQLKAPLTVVVRRGLAVDFQGGAQARELEGLLESVNDEKAYNIAELGIGCNDNASPESITLEAEKAIGTCHVALGSNHLFGGKVRVDVHLDGVIKGPTVYLDGETILESGVLRQVGRSERRIFF